MDQWMTNKATTEAPNPSPVSHILRGTSWSTLRQCITASPSRITGNRTRKAKIHHCSCAAKMSVSICAAFVRWAHLVGISSKRRVNHMPIGPTAVKRNWTLATRLKRNLDGGLNALAKYEGMDISCFPECLGRELTVHSPDYIDAAPSTELCTSAPLLERQIDTNPGFRAGQKVYR